MAKTKVTLIFSSNKKSGCGQLLALVVLLNNCVGYIFQPSYLQRVHFYLHACCFMVARQLLKIQRAGLSSRLLPFLPRKGEDKEQRQLHLTSPSLFLKTRIQKGFQKICRKRHCHWPELCHLATSTYSGIEKVTISRGTGNMATSNQVELCQQGIIRI